ncbi:Receptor-type tyrosine-protein phosphatase O, partial [Clarias magur]
GSYRRCKPLRLPLSTQAICMLMRHERILILFYKASVPKVLCPVCAALCWSRGDECVWEEGAHATEQRVCGVQSGPVGNRRQHGLLALPGGGNHHASQPEHRDAHVSSFRPLESLLPGRKREGTLFHHRVCHAYERPDDIRVYNQRPKDDPLCHAIPAGQSFFHVHRLHPEQHRPYPAPPHHLSIRLWNLLYSL